DGSTDLTPGGVSLTNGQATFAISTLTGGSHTITALYSGDSNFPASQADDAANPQVVQPAVSSTVLASSTPASVFGERVGFIGFVAVPPGAGTSPGTVTFKEGSTVLAANVSVSGGHAGFYTASLPVGSHTITAFYSGDNGNVLGSSDSTTLVVSKA